MPKSGVLWVNFDTYADAWYFHVLHFNSALSVISTVIALYFICFKSTPSIGTYKWYLLNIAACSFLFDFYMAFVYVPQPLLPAMVICTKGFLEPLGWKGGVAAFHFFLIFFGACALSIMWAFGYRLAVLTNRERLINSKLGVLVMALSQLLYQTPTLVVYDLSIRDHEAVVDAIVAKYPLIKQYFVNHSCTSTAFEASPLSIWFMSMCTVQYALVVPISVVLIVLCFSALNARRKDMSEKSVQMHRQLLISLLFQVKRPDGGPKNVERF
ncbi:SRI-2 protein [Aphelenchoides avenae]|nr:SRI-2 protein [Aphelenchus avenae]